MTVRNIAKTAGVGKSNVLRIINNSKEFETISTKQSGNSWTKSKTTLRIENFCLWNSKIQSCKLKRTDWELLTQFL